MGSFFKNIFTSYKTTLIGLVEGIVTTTVGNVVTGHYDWHFLLLGALQFLKGAFSKDANVSNSPSPLPTAQPVPPAQ